MSIRQHVSYVILFYMSVMYKGRYVPDLYAVHENVDIFTWLEEFGARGGGGLNSTLKRPILSAPLLVRDFHME